MSKPTVVADACDAAVMRELVSYCGSSVPAGEQKKPSELILGDCLDILPEIEANTIDFVLTDMPYGITRNDWDNLIDLNDLWKQLMRVVKRNGAIVLFSSGMFTAKLMTSNPSMWRYNLIWNKTHSTGFLNAKKMPMRAHEDICVFYQKLPTYNPQMTIGERKVSAAWHQGKSKKSMNYGDYGASSYDSTERYPTSVLGFTSDKQHCSLHPTQKPVALCEWLIRTYTNKGETVLDFTMGSGTTGVACANTRRNFIGIEINQDYFRLAEKRINEALCQLRLDI